MGGYWKPVNMTRGEFIHPHHVGDGLKLTQWNYSGSGVRLVIDKHWKSTDDIRALSDCGGEMQLSGSAGSQDSHRVGTRVTEEKLVSRQLAWQRRMVKQGRCKSCGLSRDRKDRKMCATCRGKLADAYRRGSGSIRFHAKSRRGNHTKCQSALACDSLAPRAVSGGSR